MATVTLPHTSKAATDPNLFSEVKANDQAIIDQVNGNLDSANLAADSVGASELADDSVVNANVTASAAIAGSKLDTGDGRLVQTTGVATGSGSLTCTGTYADIASATVTFTPDVACTALVTATFDLELSSIGSAESVEGTGVLVVDGSAQTPVATVSFINAGAATSFTSRSTATQVYRVALTAAAHTLKLQAKKTNESGTTVVTATGANCRLLYQLVAQ